MAYSRTSRHSRGLNLRNKRDVSEQNADVEEGDRLIKSIFELWERGEKEIKLEDNYKDVILILGNTGSGKSTFTQWIAGDNTKLISRETTKGTEEYIIEDHQRISDNTVKSKTIIPELVIESKTDSAYYDCPGFSDTQGASNDIAQTYFIKKVIDHSKSVKMVFVISHSSVRKGVDRQDFMKLVKHVTDLVKDIDKFKNSFAIVATKVDNTYKKGGILVEDKYVIEAIADFLKDPKQYLEDSLKSPNLSEKDRKFYENAVKFVEVLLEKENEEYVRIGIFRRPDEPGPVSDIELLQKGKQGIEKIIHERLKFTSKNNEDFGYTVSEKTKNDISDIVIEINKNLESSLTNIATQILEYYKNLVEPIRAKISLLASKPNNSIDVNFSDAEAFKDKLNIGYVIASDLMNKTKNITNPEDLLVLVQKTITNLNLDTPKDSIDYIKNQAKYFNFLQTVSDKTLGSKSWDQLFKDVEMFLANSKTAILDDVKSAAENINNQLQTNLKDAAKLMQEEYNERIKPLEMKRLPEKLRRDSRFISELIQEIENGTTTEKLVNSILYIADNIGISLPKDILRNIGNQGKYLSFLDVLSNEILVDGKMTWLPPFKNLTKYFHDSEKWYTFLEDLYYKFSEYVIQKDRQRYNVADLDDWGEVGKPQGLFVTPNNIEKFLNKIESHNVAEYQNVKNLTATASQIEELNQVLGLKLKHRPTVRCSEPHIIVKGSYILFSEIMHNLKSNSDTNNSCNNYQDQLDEGKYNLLKVFALDKVFIDTDLPFAGKGTSVSIIAPEWKVIGTRTIELYGADGDPHAESKARNGIYAGNNGRNGDPGRPGGSGQNFFGIGDTFVGGANLKLNAKGGKGGPGQTGGDGAPGVAGKDAPRPSEKDPKCEAEKFKGFTCGTLDYIEYDKIGYTIQWNYKIYGTRGGKGGNGGDGGKGGKGGNLGNIAILELQRPSKIIKLASRGEDGDIGKGGTGGRGGKDGNHQLANFKKKFDAAKCYFLFQCKHNTWWEFQLTEEVNSRGPDGSNGINGRNDKNMEHPKPGQGIRQPNIINEYKIYQREKINNRFQKFSILSFLDLLNSKNEVRKLYDISTLIDEFQDLEEQFPKLGDQINFSYFYNSLLERINDYAKSHKNIQNESKKVLNYLYTATLGRLYNLKENSEKILIIDIRAYLKMIEDNIKTLKDLQMINNKVAVINKYKENYKSGIEKKIEEAQSLIEKQINPEMEKINAEIDDHINSLIEETINLQKESEKNWDDLVKKKKDLEKTMAIKGIFNCFKIIGGVANFMGPYGKIIGTVIDGVSTVAEPLVLNDEKESIKIPSGIESSLKSLKENIEAMRGKKVEHLEKLLKNVEEEIEKNPDTLKDLKDKIKNTKDKLQKVRDKGLAYKNVRVLEAELEETIKRKGLDLKTIKGDKKILDASKAIGKIEKLFKFGSLLSDVYEKYSTNQKSEEMDAITKSLKDTSETMEMLRDYENNIYDTIAPMLQNMGDELNEISAKLKTKSQVALDVTKWQVQSSLKDMKSQMQKLTEGRGVKENLSRSIEKLDEVMTTLINIYDRIQSYQDQQNLANYIADISSVAASRINIEDQQLAKAVNRLEYAIRSNLVIEQYKSAIDALEQWVFPFAHHYIEKSMLPSQLRLCTNIENLVQKATRQIETIKQKLDLYDASIMKGDQFLQCEEFSSLYYSSKPFYVWMNEENRSSISSLLSGKEVVLKSDIEKSVPGKDAIKFSEIEFVFKIKNETAQSLLSEILRGFDIRATHLGSSYYKYAGKIFVITSNEVTISYSYEKNNDGIPIRSNEAYNRLRSGNILLSPYTFWEVRLINQTDKSTFKDLDKYKNEISIELSGFGRYVVVNRATGMIENNSFTIENNTMASSIDCRRTKYRSERSVNGIEVDGDFMTNGASKGISSPISLLHNFLNTNFVSYLVISLNHAFFGEQTSFKNDCSELAIQCSEMRNIGTTVDSIRAVRDTDANAAENDFIKGRINRKSDTIFDVNFYKNNSYSTSFLLSNQKHGKNNNSTQFLDLNCSLLLADLVTRTMTRNKYKSPIDEHLLSSRKVMLERLNGAEVRNENDIKRMLQRHLSEKEVKKSSSWFSKLNGYAKSMLQAVGLARNSNNDVYVQDLRHLFA